MFLVYFKKNLFFNKKVLTIFKKQSILSGS